MLRNVEVYQTSPLSNAENKAKIMQNWQDFLASRGQIA
jgi:hypothetical protein